MEVNAGWGLLHVDDVPGVKVAWFEQERERDGGRGENRATAESLGDPGG